MNFQVVVLLCAVAIISCADALLTSKTYVQRTSSKLQLQIRFPDFFSSLKRQQERDDKRDTAKNRDKLALLELLQSVPPNEATPKELTANILRAVNDLESTCPTPESDVIPRLAGNWELIWTAQDPSNVSTNIFSTWIK